MQRNDEPSHLVIRAEEDVKQSVIRGQTGLIFVLVLLWRFLCSRI